MSKSTGQLGSVSARGAAINRDQGEDAAQVASRGTPRRSSSALQGQHREACVAWPEECFFWSVIAAPGWRKSGELPAGLLDELAADLPLSVDDVHAVGVPRADGGLLVCAVERARLLELEPHVRALVPCSIPAPLAGGGVASSLNLLVGACESAVMRRERTRLHLLAACLVLLCGLLLAAGFWRRAAHARDSAAAYRDSHHSMLVQRGFASGERDLARELDTARRVVGDLGAVEPRIDAAPILAEVLRAWPVGVACRPTSLNVAAEEVTINLTLEGEASLFLAEFHPPTGWTQREPRINTTGSLTRVSLTLVPSGGAK